MSMSDCPKCWDTPCTCGYDYRRYTRAARIKQASVVLGIDAQLLDQLLGTNLPDKHPMADEK